MNKPKLKNKPTRKPKAKTTKGPVPERLKIEGPWEEAVGAALTVKRPVGGWPK